MPYKWQSEKKLIPRHKDRRVKLTHEQREEIRNNDLGLSINALARKYGVSKRLIQFIRFPERHEKNLENRKNRGGSKIYYDTEKHKETMKDHRRYKQSIKEDLI